MRCNECAHENPEGSKFCSACGTPFDSDMNSVAEASNVAFEENPYQAPHVNVGPDSTSTPEIPAKVLSRIKGGWIAGILTATVTLVFTLIVLNGVNTAIALDAWSFVDVFLFYIFSFGVYKKSRVAAILMFLLFVFNKIMMTIDSGRYEGGLIALILIYFYFMAIVGTFQYHHILKKKRAS